MVASEIVRELACGGARCSCVQTAKQGRGLTHCPAHQDPSPSLAVDAKGEKTLVKCHAGCSQAQVLEALRARGLWTARRRRQPRGQGDVSTPPDTAARLHHPPGVSLAQYAQAKGLPVEFLVECGLSDTFGRPVVRIPYHDEGGAEVAVRFRIALTGDRFRWKRGSATWSESRSSMVLT